jgi:hypothetical protein
VRVARIATSLASILERSSCASKTAAARARACSAALCVHYSSATTATEREGCLQALRFRVLFLHLLDLGKEAFKRVLRPHVAREGIRQCIACTQSVLQVLIKSCLPFLRAWDILLFYFIFLFCFLGQFCDAWHAVWKTPEKMLSLWQ